MSDGDPGATFRASVIKKIKTKFEKSAHIGMLSNGSLSDLVEVIPTGAECLDNWVLGCGGLPVGRCIEVYSEEGAGKSSLGHLFLAAAQRAAGTGVLYETERALIPKRAMIHGVDMDQLILGEPDSFEDVLAQLRYLLSLIPDGVGPNVIVWDSLAGTPTDKEIKGKPVPGDQARQMSQNMRVMAAMLMPKRTCLVVINQVRHKIGVIFGSPETTPGGFALKFFSSIRIAMWKGKVFKEGPDAVGHRITIKAMKNKVAMPFRKLSLRLDYRYGFDNEWSVIDFAKERELIPAGLKMLPSTYKRATEALAAMDGWYPNVFDPAAPTPKASDVSNDPDSQSELDKPDDADALRTDDEGVPASVPAKAGGKAKAPKVGATKRARKKKAPSKSSAEVSPEE